MKKILIVALIALLALSQLVATGETEKGGAEKPQVIGIAMPTKSLERWNRDGSYLKEQFEHEGYKVLLTYSDNNVTQQNNDIDNLIASNVDLLIVVAIDGESLTQVLAKAKDLNIPVIAYDRLILNTDATSYYVSFDNYTCGVLKAQFVEKMLDLEHAPKGKVYNIEFTAGDPADNNAPYFFNGEYGTLKPYIDAGTVRVVSGQDTFAEVATPQWLTVNAMSRMQNILASYYSDGTVLDVAICSNDSTALGVAQAITSDYAGANTPIITGMDGDISNLRNIVDGIQTMDVYKNVQNEATVTLEVAKAVLRGEKPGAELVDKLPVECAYDTTSYFNGISYIPSYLLVPWVVTKDNLQDLVDTGLYAWDGKYLVST